MLRLLEALRQWEAHCLQCAHCKVFDSTPMRTANLDPCPHGRRLIQYILQILRESV